MALYEFPRLADFTTIAPRDSIRPQLYELAGISDCRSFHRFYSAAVQTANYRTCCGIMSIDIQRRLAAETTAIVKISLHRDLKMCLQLKDGGHPGAMSLAVQLPVESRFNFV